MCAAEATPDLHEQRKQHLAAWRDGKAPLFVVRNSSSGPAEVPPFTFRKIDDFTLAILAWRDEAEAEKWCADHRVDPTRIGELRYSDFIQMLERADAAERNELKLEVI